MMRWESPGSENQGVLAWNYTNTEALSQGENCHNTKCNMRASRLERATSGEGNMVTCSVSVVIRSRQHIKQQTVA